MWSGQKRCTQPISPVGRGAHCQTCGKDVVAVAATPWQSHHSHNCISGDTFLEIQNLFLSCWCLCPKLHQSTKSSCLDCKAVTPVNSLLPCELAVCVGLHCKIQEHQHTTPQISSLESHQVAERPQDFTVGSHTGLSLGSNTQDSCM